MNLDIASLLDDPSATIALVGATENPSKYGSVIFRDLTRKGYAVYPVNPGRTSVHGHAAYPDLASLPAPPTIVNIVVPPDVTLKILSDAEALGIRNIWLQPGAESPAVMERLTSGPFEYLALACIMVQTRSMA
ncbi:MAG: CoA-binding protein [Acidimicrobiia bacterium]|nr:CoA-binding protein [Acidimicrobiia bacterium]